MPPEMEKNVLRFLNSNIPVHEDTITRLVLINLTKLPLSSPDALDILETLLKRAGTMTDKVYFKLDVLFILRMQL